MIFVNRSYLLIKTEVMKLQIWFDFQCPFCYIGETMLDRTIAGMELTSPVEIEYHAYQLDTHAPEMPHVTMLESFMKGHDLSEEAAEHQMLKITRLAATEGLKYNLKGVQVCSSLDAHRLMKYAEQILSPGKLKKMSFAIFKANFEENLRISDRNVLADIAVSVGLDRDEVMAMFATDRFVKEVMADQVAIDARKDFEFIPYILLDNGAVLQGVLRPDSLQKALKTAMETGVVEVDDSPKEGCGPNGCSA